MREQTQNTLHNPLSKRELALSDSQPDISGGCLEKPLKICIDS